MENAAALPRGLVTIYSSDGKAEGTKKAVAQCLWCPTVGVCVVTLNQRLLGLISKVPRSKGLWRDA